MGFKNVAKARDFVDQKLSKIMQELEDALGKTAYLASNNAPTIADLMILPEIDQLYFINDLKHMVEPVMNNCINVKRWLGDMKKMKTYDMNMKDAITNMNQLVSNKESKVQENVEFVCYGFPLSQPTRS